MGLFSFRKKEINKTVVSNYDGALPNFIPVSGFNLSSGSKVADTNTVGGQKNAYLYCPAVTAIVNMKVAMASNARVYFTDSKGNEVSSEFQKLMAKPNGKQSWSSFYQFAKTCQQVFGKSYIYVRRLPGIMQPEMFVMPNWEVKLNTVSGDFFGSQIQSYTWSHNNKEITVGADDVFILNDTGFDFGSKTGDYLDGGSRLVSCGDAVQNIIASYEARNMLLTNGGPPVIISPERDPMGSAIMMDEDKAELENRLVDRYGLQRNKKMIAIGTMPMKALKIGLSVADLSAFEEVNEDVKEVCRCFGLSPYLFNISDTTFNNFSEAQKSGYQNTIIPEEASNYSQFTYFFRLKEQMNADFSHVECMQDNENKAADALKKDVDVYGKLYGDGVITYNTYLKYIGETEITGGDKYVSDMTTQPLAVRIGVGGTQSLQAILADPNLTDNQKIGILIILFGITEQEANQMLKR